MSVCHNKASAVRQFFKYSHGKHPGGIPVIQIKYIFFYRLYGLGVIQKAGRIVNEAIGIALPAGERKYAGIRQQGF